ncbi:hypothetical protein mvi_19900 [Methylobacterium indicum]|uniref:Uncharacterized protein n=1 Tax=Methylobacterium indicum TaxID=1775910 RepID=A0A8H8WSM9_9HYPH|nr:hypothetical protein mvi_19900 [Methylobacterium indicum]
MRGWGDANGFSRNTLEVAVPYGSSERRALPRTCRAAAGSGRSPGPHRPQDVTAPKRGAYRRQVSWLADRRSRLAFPVQRTSDRRRRDLSAHSCGGSLGIARDELTEFPLSPRA